MGGRVGVGVGRGGNRVTMYRTGLDPGRFFPTLSFSGLAWGGTVANFFLCFILFFLINSFCFCFFVFCLFLVLSIVLFQGTLFQFSSQKKILTAKPRLSTLLARD